MAFGLLLLFVFVQVVAVALLQGVGLDVSVDGALTVRDALVLVLVQLAGIAVVAGIAIGGVGTTWKRLGVAGYGGEGFDRGWKLLMPAGLLVVGPTVAYALFSSDDVVQSGLGVPAVASFALLALAIAVNEELWFRGLIVDQLQLARRPWLTVFAASLLFGLPHVGATSASWLNAAGVTLAVAIPFTVVRLVVGSLWAMVAWHAIIDTWAFIHTSTVVPEGSPDVAEAIGTLVLPAVLALGYLAWFARGDRARRSLRP